MMVKYEPFLAASILLLMLGSAHAKPPEAAAVAARTMASSTVTGSSHADLMRFLLQSVEDPHQLQGFRIAILAADGVDGFDLEVPRQFLAERGATVHVIVPRSRKVLQAAGSGAVIRPKTQIAVIDPSGEEHTTSFDRFTDQVQVQDYDVVYIPGQQAISADLTEQLTMAFLQQATREGKSIFASGNATTVLVEAGLLDRRHAAVDPEPLARPALSTAVAADAPLMDSGLVHTSRDAFDMPSLMDRLVTTLLAHPAQ